MTNKVLSSFSMFCCFIFCTTSTTLGNQYDAQGKKRINNEDAVFTNKNRNSMQENELKSKQQPENTPQPKSTDTDQPTVPTKLSKKPVSNEIQKTDLQTTLESFKVKLQSNPSEQNVSSIKTKTKQELQDVKSLEKVTGDKIDQRLSDQPPKSSNDPLEKTIKGGVAIAAILLGGGGVGGGVSGGILGIESKSSDNDEFGVFPPSIHQTPPINDVEYDRQLYLITNAFLSVKDRFKDAIQNGDYNSSTFEINLGNVTIDNTEQDVIIRYNFEKGGAGNLDNTFSPIIVEISPDSIGDYAVTAEKILSQITDQETRAFVALLLSPSSALIFFIKMGLLTNFDSSKDVIAWTNSVLLEGALLFYRLTLQPNYAGATTQSLLSNFPLWLQTYFNEKKSKMFTELIKIYSEPSQNSSTIEDTISRIRQLTDYTKKVSASDQTLCPLITNDLSYSDKMLLTHAVLRLISDLGDKLPTEAIESKKELTNRMDELIPFITKILDLIKDADFEQRFIDKINTGFSTIKAIKNGKKTIKQNIAKPRLSESIEEVKDCSVITVINVCLQHFYRLSTKKFKGDYGFQPNDLLLGQGETEDAMLAVWLRCLSDTIKAEKYLRETKDTVVVLKNFNGTFSIDPNTEYNKLIVPRKNELEQVQTKLNAATQALKSSKTDANIKRYKKMKAEFDKAVQKYIDAQHSFTRAYSVYYPLAQSGGEDRTVAEFAKREFAIIKKVGLYDDTLFDSLADKFETILGLQRDMIW